MELVYLWVEDYKNIHHQGFNFSPRFECKFYDEYNEDGILQDNCKLDIQPKEHIENFFGDNINITAIVGKNGSGKSSVLEYLDLLLTHNQRTKNKFILIFKIDNMLYNFPENNIHRDCTFRDIDDIKYLNFFYDNDRRIMGEKLSLNNANISKIICELHEQKVDLELSTFMYFPIKINYSLINILEDFKENTKFGLYERMSIPHNNDESNLIEKIQNIDDEYHAFLIRNELLKNEYFDYEMLLDKTTLSQKYISEIFFNTYFKCVHEPCIISKLSNKEIFFLMKYRYFFNFDFIDKKQRRFSDLSHGEKTLFGQLINIFYHITKHSNKYKLFLFDEPELSLHPNWQKKYLKEVHHLLLNFDEPEFHIILTSHSPFLLSDIPKQNIIFLDKDQDGNCKVVNGLKEKKETFGANIHTLLSDSFFMEDGLMGEFAKGKIDKAIKILNQEKLDEKELKYCEQIISIIGEPIVKNQLQRMLDSKRLKKVDEIDTIKQSMIEMQKRLDELEK